MASKYIQVNYTEPSYLTLTPYERSFPLDHWRSVFATWGHLSLYMSAAYFVLVFSGRYIMSNRAPFKLNRLLTVWNILLAAMSSYACARIAPEFFHVLLGPNGFHNSICEWPAHNGATAFWSWVLLLSKVVELGDTAFIVLRKQNLLFLHWYHHMTTLMSWWVMYSWYEPVQQWYVVMNSFVHSFMYSYYALKSMKVPLPRPLAMGITTIQLLQMLGALVVNVYTVWAMYFNGTPENCPHRNWFGLKVSFAIYVPYSILFAKLFLDSYITKPKMKGASAGVQKKKE